MLCKPNDVDLKFLGLDLCIDNEELYNNFFIIDNIDEENNETEQDFDENEYDKPNDDENCITCFHSDGRFCSCKGIYINKLSPICWCYRDCLTMRASSDFQDDYDYNDFDE